MIKFLESIPEDKQKHIAVGLLIGLIFGQSVPLALMTLIVAALGKELYDYIYNMFISDVHEVSLYDSLATLAGGVVGVVLVYVGKLIIGVLL